MTEKSLSLISTVLLLCSAASAAEAASDCQPILDPYAAQAKVPALRKTVTTPGMADPVEIVLTQEAMYSRVGPNDAWTKNVLDDAMRAVMAKGAPSAETIGDCRAMDAQETDGVSGTAYEFEPSEATGNAPGERITVLIDGKSGLPLSEVALKAGTKVKITYDGVTAPAP